MRLVVLAACGFAATACIQVVGNDDEVYCTAELRYGVVVEVRDAVTDAPLLGARGAVHEGTYVDSLRPLGASNLGHAAGERSGTYSVNVERSGYAPWGVGNVVVSRDRCHVQTVRLVARLQPL